MNKKQKGGKYEGKRIWNVPLKDLGSVTKKRIKRRVKKVKKKIGETTLKDIAKRTTPIGPVLDIGEAIHTTKKRIKGKRAFKKYLEKERYKLQTGGQKLGLHEELRDKPTTAIDPKTGKRYKKLGLHSTKKIIKGKKKATPPKKFQFRDGGFLEAPIEEI